MKTINLLPKEKQKEFAYRKILSGVVSLIWLTAATFFLVLLVQFGIKVYLQGEEVSLKTNIEELKQQANKEENAEIKKRIKELNDLVADYTSLSEKVPKFSKVVRAFAPLVPEEVSIASMRIDPLKKLVDITGHSPTRELVIRLHDNIVEAGENFPNVDYPLENIVKSTDIVFHFTFNLNEELIK